MERITKFKTILNTIKTLLENNEKTKHVKLLVVSKRRPIEQILEIYNEGHRDFGENYVNELIEKSEKLPSDINWHLIGHLQTNKCKKLLQSVKNLKLIESVDSYKLAEELEKQCLKLDIKEMKIYIQIHISQEETKTGVLPEEVLKLCEEIIKNLKIVKLEGIMSLGDIGNVEQFDKMVEIKNKICEKFNINPEELNLSLGTSDDYQEAIRRGSNEVRIGGLLFDI